LSHAEWILPQIQNGYPREEWGEAWLCAVKAEQGYDPSRCHFWPYFTTKFAYHKIDQQRAECGRMTHGRRMTPGTLAKRRIFEPRCIDAPKFREQLTCNDPDAGAAEAAEVALATLRDRYDLYELGRCVASGMDTRHIAQALGVTKTTISNHRRIMRDVINSPGIAITEPVKCA
jgi:hypothetical protein